MDTSVDPVTLAYYKLDLARRIVRQLKTGHDRAVNLALQAAEIFDGVGDQAMTDAALAFAAEVEAALARSWRQ